MPFRIAAAGVFFSAILYKSILRSTAAETSFTPDAIKQHPFAVYGLPSYSNLRVMEGYISSLNYERRIPNWVLERFEPKKKGEEKSSKGNSKSNNDSDDDGEVVSREGSKFYSDGLVPELFRATNADYSTPGMSRGHLAAAQFHKGSQNEMDETFNLSTNIVPQDMTMNGCDWFRLEAMTKRLAQEFPKGLYVVTGPCFVPTYEVGRGKDNNSGRRMVQYYLTGAHDVAVPTHLFKVLLGVKEDDSKAIAAFVMPNGPIVEEQPLVAFQVPVKYIEQITGLQMFPELLHSNKISSSFSSSTYDMCKKHKCEGRNASFSKGFRMAGRIRAATTVQEANAALQHIVSEGVVVDAKLQKEYERKLAELKGK